MLVEFNQRHSRSTMVIVYLLVVVPVFGSLFLLAPEWTRGPVYPALCAATVPLAGAIVFGLAGRGRLATTCLVGCMWTVLVFAALLLLAGLYFLANMSGNWR